MERWRLNLKKVGIQHLKKRGIWRQQSKYWLLYRREGVKIKMRAWERRQKGRKEEKETTTASMARDRLASSLVTSRLSPFCHLPHLMPWNNLETCYGRLRNNFTHLKPTGSYSISVNTLQGVITVGARNEKEQMSKCPLIGGIDDRELELTRYTTAPERREDRNYLRTTDFSLSRRGIPYFGKRLTSAWLDPNTTCFGQQLKSII